MKNICVIYDISDDKKRDVMARTLIYYGLHRIQYSVFNGMIEERDMKPMVEDLMKLGLDEDKVLIIELCNSCLAKSLNLGRSIEISEHLII